MFNFFSSKHVGRLLLKACDPDCGMKRVGFDYVKTQGGGKEVMGICIFRFEHYCRFGPVDIRTRATSKNLSVMSKTAKVARERVERMAERLAEEVEPTR
jgi:hypothetical protein